jgi:DNA-binding CsgD family transcriptional regulator
MAGAEREMLGEIFYEFIDSMGAVATKKDGCELLRTIADRYGLTNAAYLAINIPTLTEQQAYGVTTYNPDWVSRYVSENYIRLDPVVKHGMMGLLPLDWGSLRGKHRRIDRFFDEAGEYGVGKQGLSFPIRGAHGETALFSVNSNESSLEWGKRKRALLRDMQIFAYHFHCQILESEGVRFAGVTLTAREMDCLKWASEGKTSWETGEILGIRSTTVEFYIEQARVKLNAMNKVQAVAKAIRVRAI